MFIISVEKSTTPFQVELDITLDSVCKEIYIFNIFKSLDIIFAKLVSISLGLGLGPY